MYYTLKILYNQLLYREVLYHNILEIESRGDKNTLACGYSRIKSMTDS